jgi:hypothetical protein
MDWPMQPFEHTAVIVLVLATLLSGTVIVPLVNGQPPAVTLPKLAALCVPVAGCFYLWSLIPALVLLWPLSLIWFPKYWGDFTGFIQGRYVDQTSPPLAVAAMGWLFLVGIPLGYLLIFRQ